MNLSKNILLIDDDLDDQLFFTDAINGIEGAILHGVANNGKEALDILKNPLRLPDIIFMDINMPVMNGIECLTEIIKSPQIKNIPVIMLSSDTGKTELTRTLGAKAFIKKPSDSKRLQELLEQHINLNFIIDSNMVNQPFQTALPAF